MKAINTKQKNSKRRFVIIAILAAVLLIVAYLGYAYTTKDIWPFVAQSESASRVTENGINYSPPTQQEIKESQDAKKNASESATSASSSATDEGSKRTISVGVSYASIVEDRLEIRAFVDGVIEGNGTCTATMTNGSRTITKSSRAFIDASSSICEPIQQDIANLTPGQWQIVVRYSSPDAQGVSDKIMVTI